MTDRNILQLHRCVQPLDYPARHIVIPDGIRAMPSARSGQTPEQKRLWYLANQDKHKARAKARNARARQSARAYVDAHLQNHPCVDCGESDPVVLDFDHVGEKSFGIASCISQGRSLEKIAAEITKCEVRCANCHRRKTHRTLGYREKRQPSGRRFGHKVSVAIAMSADFIADPRFLVGGYIGVMLTLASAVVWTWVQS